MSGGNGYISTKDTHDCEVKVRLTETDDQLLKAVARKLGMPPAVLARTLIKQNLSMDIKQLAIAS